VCIAPVSTGFINSPDDSTIAGTAGHVITTRLFSSNIEAKTQVMVNAEGHVYSRVRRNGAWTAWNKIAPTIGDYLTEVSAADLDNVNLVEDGRTKLFYVFQLNYYGGNYTGRAIVEVARVGNNITQTAYFMTYYSGRSDLTMRRSYSSNIWGNWQLLAYIDATSGKIPIGYHRATIVTYQQGIAIDSVSPNGPYLVKLTKNIDISGLTGFSSSDMGKVWTLFVDSYGVTARGVTFKVIDNNVSAYVGTDYKRYSVKLTLIGISGTTPIFAD
jgi:hypothetical protein